MKRLLFPLLAGVLSAPGQAAQPEIGAQPRLLVLIVADQMGDGLLDLHGPHMRSGFRRLLDEGRRFEEALVDHAPSNSMPGHLAAASGSLPRRHGLIDNRWIELDGQGRDPVLGFGDPGCRTVTAEGAEEGDTRLGPARIEVPTIVEWVLAASPAARFASIATGGGVAVLHAGKARGPVLWFNSRQGGYTTSSCHADSLPPWAIEFNARLAERHMASDWTLSAPTAMLAPLRPDAAQFENRGRDTAFPHRRPENGGNVPAWFVDTPLADEATLALAAAAVEGESLGADTTPDILTIGLASLDHVGHAFGPYSVEQADAIYRLDAALGGFFAYLDRKVGEGRWAVALTADHGAPPAPEDAQRFGIEGARRISQEEAQAAIATIVEAAERHDDPEERSRAAARAAESLDFVARALTPADLRGALWNGDEIARLYANSFRPGRVSLHPLYSSDDGRSPAEFGIIVLPFPHVVINWATSIHGSPYAYDREVEMIFMGPGVDPGRSSDEARTIDVAPSLAALAGIGPTAEIDGRVLTLRRLNESEPHVRPGR